MKTDLKEKITIETKVILAELDITPINYGYRYILFLIPIVIERLQNYETVELNEIYRKIMRTYKKTYNQVNLPIYKAIRVGNYSRTKEIREYFNTNTKITPKRLLILIAEKVINQLKL